ncbi:hypothetical protein ACFPPD_23240 [Cohnella suwonensis]|uniref:CpXC domain-containing protein n=1 Tax=Cohnella suwonensis TaxID=696072 RepID=A0ABW0M174_9BACL
MNKFVDNGTLIYEFSDLFLVKCPNCNGMAKVIPLIEPGKDYIKDKLYFSDRRVICNTCGFNKDKRAPLNKPYYLRIVHFGKDWKDNCINIGGNHDWIFGYPLYLNLTCKGHILWAYNLRHLEFIESFINEKLRNSSTYYLSLVSRLPKWLIESKNKDEVLKGIKKLKVKYMSVSQ